MNTRKMNFIWSGIFIERIIKMKINQNYDVLLLNNSNIFLEC